MTDLTATTTVPTAPGIYTDSGGYVWRLDEQEGWTFLDAPHLSQPTSPVRAFAPFTLLRRTGESVEDSDAAFLVRLIRIREEISLGMDCTVIIDRDKKVPNGRFYFQIECLRKDVITGEMGYGRGGKAYLSDDSTDNELIQTVLGLYLSYWTHEARENFQWRGRRVFGPHISTEALWEAAPHVDVRSAKHVEDRA